MTGSGKKWLMGCGIGCGLMVIILGAVGTCGYLGVRKIKDRAEHIEQSNEALQAAYGEPEDFVPGVDGRIAPERMETFLAVRAGMSESRDEMADILLLLDGKRDGNVIEKIKAGVALIPSIIDFLDDRNQVMVEQGMGLGEYLYIYCIAYYSWLDKNPADGPEFAINTNDEDQRGFHWTTDEEETGDVREKREREVRRELNRILGRILENQVAAGAGEVVQEEARAMDRESLRLPYETGLTEQLQESLDPYRSRLEESYVPIMNVIEVAIISGD